MAGSNRSRKVTMTLFVIYMVVLFWIIVFKFDVPFSDFGSIRSINLIPFSRPLVVNYPLPKEAGLVEMQARLISLCH
ncbi:MAG: hypothetical protein WBJ29_01625 [Fervidobacterium sp.]